MDHHIGLHLSGPVGPLFQKIFNFPFFFLLQIKIYSRISISHKNQYDICVLLCFIKKVTILETFGSSVAEATYNLAPNPQSNLHITFSIQIGNSIVLAKPNTISYRNG